MIALLRSAAAVLLAVGLWGLLGALRVDAAGKRPVELLPGFVLLLAASALMAVRAQRLARNS